MKFQVLHAQPAGGGGMSSRLVWSEPIEATDVADAVRRVCARDDVQSDKVEIVKSEFGVLVELNEKLEVVEPVA